jgi:hypothetical protein
MSRPTVAGAATAIIPYGPRWVREQPAAPGDLGVMPAWRGQEEPPARLARELGLSRTPLHPLRQRIQAHLNATAPTTVMRGTAFEADALYHNAGKSKPPHRDPHDPPRRRAHQREELSTAPHKKVSNFKRLPQQRQP